MAYLFNSIGGDADQEGKQNIFGGQQTDQGVTSNAQGSAGNEAIQKGSAAGGGGGGGSGGAAAPTQAQKKPSGGYNPQAQASAYSAAAQSMKLPTKALSSAESSLKAGEQSLQEKANAYQGSAQETAKGYNLGEETLKGAATGNQQAYQKTAERLGGTSPTLFGGFEGLGESTPNIQNIRDVGSLYRAEAGPNYTAGQSRFDAAMLRKNPEFIQQQQSLLAREKALKEADVKARETETEKARGLLGQEYQKSTEDIRKKLGGYGEEVISGAKAKEAAEDLRRASLDPTALGAAQQDRIKKQIEDDLKHADPHSAEYRSLKFLKDQYDLGQFANVDKDTQWQEFVNPEQAAQYNRVQGLLGTPEMLTPSQGGPGAEAAFNERGAYQNILDQIRGKRQEADIAGQQRLAAIQAGAGGRANEAFTNLKTTYEQGIPGEAYTKEAPTWQQMLNPQEVEELNYLQQDLGVLAPEQYQYANYDPNAEVKQMQDMLFKKQATQADLDRAIASGNMSTVPAAAPGRIAAPTGGGISILPTGPAPAPVSGPARGGGGGGTKKQKQSLNSAR